MKTILTATMLMLSLFLQAQNIITGRITDIRGNSLPGANISLKGTYDGATADTSGYFKFSTPDTGKQVLLVSYIGYKTMERMIFLPIQSDSVIIRMEEQAGEINSVMITAGAFETGDLKRPIVLKPMDIATTPSAVGDIYGALTTLPGTQIVGNEGGLYVRGGEGYETKTFIDGLQVSNPYMSKMPDLPTRSRFSPILFTGTAFSTGGYSAEYGQALSSAINLNTAGLADKSQGSLSIMSVGFSASYTQRWEKTSLSGTAQYINMQPYNSLTNSNVKWKQSPEQTGGTMLFRRKIGKYGLLKVFGSTDHTNSALYYNYKGDTSRASLIDLRNGNYYINALYNDQIAERWRIRTGFAFGADYNQTGFDLNELTEETKSFHHRITVTHDLNDKVTFKMGEEVSGVWFKRSYYASDSLTTYNSSVTLNNYALYAEPEIHLSDKLVTRLGIRAEYLSLSKEWQVVPRISLALHTGDYSQISLAYGLFRQRPENQHILINQDLGSEKATHLIFNYQYEVNDRIFRIETYRKWYNNLVKYASDSNPDPSSYNNQGKGFAEGIDIFWRDSRSVKNLDYWLSYSYIHTRRNYKTFSRSLVPSFISPHTFSAVMKYYISKVSTYAGITYMHASPKTWYNPAFSMGGDHTRAFNDLSLNLTCIRPFLGTYCAFLININNIFGFENVYGYNYSVQPDDQGNYTRFPIKPQSKRFFVIGAYLIL